MKKPAHVIGKLVYDMETSLPEEKAKELFLQYNYLLKEQLPKILEEVLNEFSLKNSFIRINKLEIDLGNFNAGKLEEDAPYAFRYALKNALEKLIQESLFPDQNVLIIDEKQETLNTFIYYLKYGALPWFAKAGEINFSLEQIKKILIELEQNQFTILRKEFADSPEIRRRFIMQFTREDLPEYVKKVFPEQSEIIRNVKTIEKIISKSELRISEKVVKQLIWETIVENPENQKVFWSLIIAGIAKEGFVSPSQAFMEMYISALEVKESKEQIFSGLEKAATIKENPTVFYREIITSLIKKERFGVIENFIIKKIPEGNPLINLATDLIKILHQFNINTLSKKQFLYQELFTKEALHDISLPSEEKALQLIKQLTEQSKTTLREATKVFQASTSGKSLLTTKEKELENLFVKLVGKSGDPLNPEKGRQAKSIEPDLIFQQEVITIVEQTIASEGKGLAQREKMAIGILVHYLNFAHVPNIIFSSSGINDVNEFEEIISRLLIKNRDFIHRLIQRSNATKDPIVPVLLKKNFSESFHSRIFEPLPAKFKQEDVFVKSYLNTIITEQALPWYYLNSGGIVTLVKTVSQFIEKSPDIIKEVIPVLKKEDIPLLEKYLSPKAVKFISLRVEENLKSEKLERRPEEIAEKRIAEKEEEDKEPKRQDESVRQKSDDLPSLEDKKLLFIITHFAKHKELPAGVHTPIEEVIKTALSKAAKVAAIMFAGLAPEEMDVLKKEISQAILDKIQKAIEDNLKNMEEQKHKTFENELDKGEPVYINNSGMSLLHPFLQ